MAKRSEHDTALYFVIKTKYMHIFSFPFHHDHITSIYEHPKGSNVKLNLARSEKVTQRKQ